VRRRPRYPQRPLLLACPRVSPEWELGALRVLMKPHDWTRGAIEHRRPDQRLRRGAREHVESVREFLQQRLDADFEVHFPDAGDFFFVAEVPSDRLDAARAFALLLSARLRGVWLTLDRLFVLDGSFYRRQRGYKFNLVPAANIRLPRDIRAALRDIL
jgi:hypothetical protein